MGIDIKKYKCMIYNENMKKQNKHEKKDKTEP